MTQPDSQQPTNARGTFPYGPPENQFSIADTDAIQDEEWHHHDDASLPGHDPWGGLEEFGQAPDWPDQGVFMPADDDGQPVLDDPSRSTQPYGTPTNRVVRRISARLVATAATLILCVAAITFVMFPRNHTIRISPADNPAAAASPHTPSIRSGGPSPSAQPKPPALTKAAAERVLARYWQVNNAANESRSDTVLRTIEGGSSYGMDAGTYQTDQVTDPSNSQYVAFTAENATYYIPRLPSGVYPQWFVAMVTYADLATPQHATGAGFVLFTQATKNAAWKNVLEPYFLPDTGPGPFIETDADGYAISASSSDETGLSVTSGQIQEVTAESLDSNSAMIKNPGNLADLRDEAYFSGKLPTGSTDTDKHSASGRVFALETVGGGVLTFYAISAQLALAPPPGQTFEVGIPGYYSSSQTLTSATVEYSEQFATYIPPNQASPQILADASGITGRE